MVGITSYGAYIPMLRLSVGAIAGGKPGGPEKAVANWDEDAITMAVAAAVDCLRGIERGSVDGVLFASTSYPFKEKQGAAMVARALDLRRDVVTADVGDSLRAGTTALRSAVDAVKAGSARRVLVVAGETRMAAPRSALEANLGDGAAAFLVGGEDVALAVAASHAVSDEMIDVWRADGDQFVHAWEERFVVDHGYRENVREVVRGLLAKTGLAPKDFAKIVLYGPDPRSHATVVRELGFAESQAADPLFGKVGNAGAAFAPLLLTGALERAKAGDRILLVSYGDGAEASVLEATPVVERLEGRRGVSWHLARRAEMPSYDLYLRFRQLLATERDRLSDRVGAVKSFTFDNFAGSPSPPLIATVTDVDGARLYLQMTDASPKEVKLDLPVELTFRKMHEAGGTPNYYWKCTPVR